MQNYLESVFDLNQPDQVALFDELPLWSAPFGVRLLEAVRFGKVDAAVDIGCGTGFPLMELAMRLGTTARVYGIDPWVAALDRAEKKLAQNGIRNVTLIHGQAELIPLENETIDLVTSNNGLNNVTDSDRVLDEIERILKPGGQLVQTLNLEGSMIEFYQVFEEVLKSSGLGSQVSAVRAHILKKRKPLPEVLSQLKDHGFTENTVRLDHFDYRFSDGTALLNHYFIRLAFMQSWKDLVPVQNQADVFRSVESRLNDLARQQGFITLSIPFALIDSRKL